jgi:hypothetical protein
VAESLFQQRLIVWQNLKADYGKSCLVQNFSEHRPTSVLPLAFEPFVTDGQYCRSPHTHHFCAKLTLILQTHSEEKRAIAAVFARLRLQH